MPLGSLLVFSRIDMRVGDMNKTSIKKLFKKWIKPLGLDLWDVNVVLYDSTDEYAVDCPGAPQEGVRMGLMFCYADWQYRLGTIGVNMEVVDLISEELLEQHIVHELCHLLLNEMQRYDYDPMHEERVATDLAKAFMRVRNG
jgi:hypothetical protein